jgi:nucleoside diphosphate kinase
MANQEQTFIMIKPDGVARGLVGEVIKRFEQKVLVICSSLRLSPKA